MAEEMFRYLAIREAKRVGKSNRKVDLSVAEQDQSELYKALVDSIAKDSRAKSRALAERHQKKKEFLSPFVGQGKKLFSFENLLTDLEEGIDAEILLDAALKHFKLSSEKGKKVAVQAFLNLDEIKATRKRVIDAILSHDYAPTTQGYSYQELTTVMKLLHILELASTTVWPFDKKRPLDDVLAALLSVLPAGFAPPAKKDPLKNKDGEGVEQKDGGYDSIADAQKRIQEFSAALDDLTQLDILRQSVNPSTSVPKAKETEKVGTRMPVLSQKAFNQLKETTKSILKEYGFDRDTIDPTAAASVIEQELARLQSNYEAKKQHTYVARIGGMLVKVMPRIQSRRPLFPPEDVGQVLTRDCVHYTGIGDLRIVKQELVAYELVDIGHIENVLQGEEKERAHRRFDRSEDFIREFEEVTNESDKEFASTERHELEIEAQKEVQEQVHIEGSLTLSGSYGPTVDFSTTISGGYSRNSNESSRRASKFAMEVTEKAVNKIKEKKETERRRTTIREIEEHNKHSIKNAQAGAKHVRGVYRWLNKIYKAQVYTYGLRHMLEFVVPEPAAFYLWSLKDHSTLDRIYEKPEFGPSDINRYNWMRRAATYHVQGIKAPPSEFQWVSYKYPIGSDTIARHTQAESILIPEGYRAIGALVSIGITSNRTGCQHEGAFFAIHDQTAYITDNDFAQFFDFSRSQPVVGNITVSYRDFGYYSVAIGIDVLCKATVENIQQWQYDTFAAIMEAYNQYEVDYQAKLRALELAEGITIEGRNPAENTRIIKRELQRACLSLVMESDLDTFDAIREIFDTDDKLLDDWRIDFDAVMSHGTLVRFLQHAFEWENMTYVFYPPFLGSI